MGEQPGVELLPLHSGMSIEEALAVDQGIAVGGYWGAVRSSQALHSGL